MLVNTTRKNLASPRMTTRMSDPRRRRRNGCLAGVVTRKERADTPHPAAGARVGVVPEGASSDGHAHEASDDSQPHVHSQEHSTSTDGEHAHEFSDDAHLRKPSDVHAHDADAAIPAAGPSVRERRPACAASPCEEAPGLGQGCVCWRVHPHSRLTCPQPTTTPR